MMINLGFCAAAAPNAGYSAVYDGVCYSYNNLPQLEEQMQKCEDAKTAAYNMANAARELGYSEEHDVILLAQTEWRSANDEYTQYLTIYNAIIADYESRWKMKWEEYPAATYIWNYFAEQGYNEYVIAGLLGNMMVEAGGSTLAIQPEIYGNGFYGICQWNKAYSDVWGTSLEYQCDFLNATIKYELDTYGYAWRKGANFDTFCGLQSASDAAKFFAVSYERCGSGSYWTRQKCAETAYRYFVVD